MYGGLEDPISLCREALSIYPDCVDAILLLTQLRKKKPTDAVKAYRRAVKAGRRDLGETFFTNKKEQFWIDPDTQPYMRALECLAGALTEVNTPESLDEAITVYEEMLDLNPKDDQDISNKLMALYLQRKRYHDVQRLIGFYPDAHSLLFLLATVIATYGTGREESALKLLKQALKRNQHLADYLSGKKRRPNVTPKSFIVGHNTEALVALRLLRNVLKNQPEIEQWLKDRCSELCKPPKRTKRR